MPFPVTSDALAKVRRGKPSCVAECGCLHTLLSHHAQKGDGNRNRGVVPGAHHKTSCDCLAKRRPTLLAFPTSSCMAVLLRPRHRAIPNSSPRTGERLLRGLKERGDRGASSWCRTAVLPRRPVWPTALARNAPACPATPSARQPASPPGRRRPLPGSSRCRPAGCHRNPPQTSCPAVNRASARAGDSEPVCRPEIAFPHARKGVSYCRRAGNSSRQGNPQGDRSA